MKLGFIGCGNMASAMIGGIIQKGIAAPEEIIASGRSQATAQRIAGLGIRRAENNCQVVQESQVIVIAVKPQYYQEVIAEIKDCAAPEKIFVSIAPGKTLAWLESLFGRPVKLIRTMPNTPAQVGEGMSALTPNQLVSAEEAFSRASARRSWSASPCRTRWWVSAAALRPISSCSSRPWLTPQWPRECPGPRLTALPPKPSWEAPRWFWTPAGTREN